VGGLAQVSGASGFEGVVERSKEVYKLEGWSKSQVLLASKRQWRAAGKSKTAKVGTDLGRVWS